MPAYECPESLASSKDPVSYIAGWGPIEEMFGKPIQLSRDTFYMSSTLIKVMPFILWHPTSIEGGHWEHMDVGPRVSDSQFLSAV